MVDSDTISRIITKLQDFEKTNDITIVFAVEAGSRTWGLSSDDSDYDIRFVYFRNDKITYITVNKIADTISGISDDREFDWQGWDILKTIGHLKESNPNILEWLYSPVVYINKYEFKEKCLNIVNKMHTHMSLMYHYYNMAKRNNSDLIEGNDIVISKKYFYVIRPVATLLYIMEKYIRQPDESFELIIDFNELLKIMVFTKLIDSGVNDQIQYLIGLKRDNIKMCPTNAVINDWITSIFERFEGLTKRENPVGNDVDFNVQSLISIHKKLENETKKLVMILNKHGSTARSNYLSPIGLALQLLWLISNPDKHAKDLPAKINRLLKELIIDGIVVKEINNVIEELIVEETKIEDRIYIPKDFSKIFIDDVIKYIHGLNDKEFCDDTKLVYDDLDISEKLRAGIDSMKIKPIRNDVVELMLKNFINVMWLIGNPEEGVNDIPKNIVETGDKSKIISDKLLKTVKQIIDESKPKYIVSKNDIIIEWLTNTITVHEETIKKTKDNLLKIRDINVQKRLHKSMKHVDPKLFDALIRDIMS
jgi:predicted nucleotidyltransferase